MLTRNALLGDDEIGFELQNLVHQNFHLFILDILCPTPITFL